MARPWLIRYMGRMDGTDVDIYADLCPGAVRGFQKGGGEISNVIVFKKILKNRPSRVLLQTTFCGRGGGEGPQPPPLSAYVCVSFFKLSSRQIYIVLSTLLFLSPSFALQPLHSYLTSFQIYSFYANSSFLEKFSIFFSRYDAKLYMYIKMLIESCDLVFFINVFCLLKST